MGLLSLDVVAVIGHVVADSGASYARIDVDHSVPELYQYVKFLVASAALGQAFVRSKRWTPAVWSVGFALAFLDDVLRIHERGGNVLAPLFAQLTDGAVVGREPGEVLILVTAVAVMGFLMLVARNHDSAWGWEEARLAQAGVVLLVVGAVIDLVGASVRTSALKTALTLVEDGGEMIVVSLMAALALWASQGVMQAHSQLTSEDEALSHQP